MVDKSVGCIQHSRSTCCMFDSALALTEKTRLCEASVLVAYNLLPVRSKFGVSLQGAMWRSVSGTGNAISGDLT